jgi:hypothetical protein
VISAREFCRERGFPHALFLTYAFDPLFFERVPLRDLERGGSRNIVIAADAGQVRHAMRQSLEQLVPRHRGFDWLILSHLRMGSCSEGTRSSMLRGTPG